ncbi:MAG: hypothetical protein COV70_03630, partial [Parcubacteria group bacterium CG11_big_fil_rev_8_21_14_0_20_39_22]
YGENVFVFYIGSESVSGAIARFSSSKNPEPIFSVRKSLPNSKKTNEKDYSRLLYRLISDVSRELIDRGIAGSDISLRRLKRPKKAYCILSDPWCNSTTKIITEKKSKPFTVTSSFLRSLLHNQELSFGEKNMPFLKSTPDIKDVEIVERKIISTELNGYRTENPYEKKASELKMATMVSIMSRDMASEIRDIMTSILHVEHIELHSFLFMSYTNMRLLFNADVDYIFITVGKDRTEQVFVRGGSVINVTSFSVGRNTLITDIQKQTGGKIDPVVAVLMLAEESDANEHHLERTFKGIASQSAGKWQNSFKTILQDFSKRHFLPRQVFLVAEQDIASSLKSLIKKVPVSELILKSTPFNVTVLDDALLRSKGFDMGEKNDHFLFLSLIFLNSIRGKG